MRLFLRVQQSIGAALRGVASCPPPGRYSPESCMRRRTIPITPIETSRSARPPRMISGTGNESPLSVSAAAIVVAGFGCVTGAFVVVVAAFVVGVFLGGGLLAVVVGAGAGASSVVVGSGVAVV